MTCAADSCANSRRKRAMPASRQDVEVARWPPALRLRRRCCGSRRRRCTGCARPASSRSATRVGFAGAAAIAVAGAGGEEAGEDAVLGVEDGQVLIGDGFDAIGAGFAGQFGDLGAVEVVGRSEEREAEIEEFARGEGVGGVEAEVADQVRVLARRAGIRAGRWSGPGWGSRRRAGSRRSFLRRVSGCAGRRLAGRGRLRGCGRARASGRRGPGSRA